MTFHAALSQSGEISPDFSRFYGGGIRHNEDIMHSFQNCIVWLIPNHPLPLETRIWKLVVRALVPCERFLAVDSPVLRGFFSGYSGFPPSLKSMQIGHLRATSLPVSILPSRVNLTKYRRDHGYGFVIKICFIQFY